MKKEKFNLTGYDPVETPDEVIASDKNTERKEAFFETYKRIMKIIPEYFIEQRKKRRNGSSGGSAFSQSIVVTPDKATIETTGIEKHEEIQEEREEERELEK